MPLIDYPAVETLDGETRDLLEGTRTEGGDVPAFPRMLANNPDVLGAALGQFGEVMYGGRLEPDLKQLAFVVVSRANECAYCAASHGSVLVNGFGLPEARLEDLARGDYSALSDRQRAVAAFARRAAEDPKRVTSDHVDALRSVGFDDSDVLELTAVVAQASFANTVVDVLDVLPGDESPDLDRYYPSAGPA